MRDEPRPNVREPAPAADIYRTYHDATGTANLSTTVIHALADVMGVDISETGFTLNDVVDPDALDRIFRPRADGTSRVGGSIRFSAQGYRVTVYSDGEIVIEPPARRPPPRRYSRNR